MLVIDPRTAAALAIGIPVSRETDQAIATAADQQRCDEPVHPHMVREHTAATTHTGRAGPRSYGFGMSPIAEAKREWHAFKNDRPGKRFEHQHDRLQQRCSAVRIGLAIAGIILLAAGIALLVLPGPGIPLLVFGLALLAGLSGALARALDRTEPVLRDEAKQMKRGWHRLSGGAKAGVCAVAVVGLAAVAFGAYRIVI